jgi:formiminoglutamase
MKLPLLISVPHAGLTVPEEVKDICILTREQIVADGDEEAAEVYAFESITSCYVTTGIARAIIDVNRPEEDRGPDGIVKVNTCHGIPIYREPLSEAVIESLLQRYYRPYHRRLTELAGHAELGLDCHTMAAVGPKIAPDAGHRRPYVCLSNAEGTCPKAFFDGLINCFTSVFGENPAVNMPFKGGHIIRRHATELPWIQVEISRAPFVPTSEKHRNVLEAIELFCKTVL